MKIIISTLVSVFLFVLSIPLFAQSSYQMYVSNISTDKEVYSVGETVVGQFDLFNMSDVAQSDIYYVVEIGSYDIETLELTNLRGQSEKIGPMYVKGKSQITLPYTYRLPQSITGQSAIQIVAYLKDGTLVGKSEFPINISGQTNQANLQIGTQHLRISDFDEDIEPLIGPTVYESEEISFNYSILSDIETEVTPVLRLYDRVDNPDALVDTLYYPPITVTSEESAYTIDLPVDVDPLVYFGVLSFEDEENQTIYSTKFRYIVAGPIATIRNITTDVLDSTKGKKIPFILSYGTQPLDELRPDKQTGASELIAKVQLINSNGEEVGNVESKLNSSESEIELSIESKENLENLYFKAQIVTPDGNILDEYESELPTSESVSDQKSMNTTEGLLVRIFLYAGIIALLLVVILSYVAWRRKHSFKIPLVVLAAILSISASVFGVTYVQAGITADGQEYLDSVERDLLEGWKIYQSYRTKYDKGGDLKDYGNFQVTSVSSPLPPKLKIYEPGEKFKLSIDAVYGDCNNESRRYWAFAYSPEVKWWNQTPPKGSSEDWNNRLAYWQNAKLTTKLIDWNGGDSWKELFLITDIAPIFDTVSEKKSIPLKQIVKILGIQERKECMGKFGCYTNGLTAKLYGFDEFPNDEDAADFVSWARTNKNKAESVKDIIVDFKKGTKDPVSSTLANFDFADVSKLKINTECEDVWWGKAGYKEVCTQSAGNQETTTYISRLKSLKSENNSFTSGPLNEFYDWYTRGEHTTELTPIVANKAYTAPTVPGFHKMYFYLYQSGNSGVRDITAVQTICVRGAGVCPNENQPIEVSCSAGVTPIQAGSTATFTSTVKNNVGKITYSWKVNNIEVKKTASYVLQNIQKGTYQPTLTVTDSLGRSKTATCAQLAVRDPLTVSCAISGNSVKSSVTGKIAGNPLTYSWKVDNANIKSATPNITIKNTDSKATVTVKDTKTGATVSSSCNRGDVMAVACVPNPDPASVEEEVTITPEISGGTAPFTYEWKSANGQKIGNTKILKRSWESPGVKMPSFTVTDGVGKKDTQSCSVTIEPAENLGSFGVSCSAPRVLPGQQATFTATTQNADGAVTYQWKDDDEVNIAGATSAVYRKTYNEVGSYLLNISATNKGVTVNNFCRVTVGCNSNHYEGKTTACINGSQNVYSCTSSGWTTTSRPCAGEDEEEPDDSVPVVNTFEFDPGIVSIGDQCGLNLSVSNVSTCTLTPTTPSAPILISGTGGIIQKNKERIIPVGRYTLSCTNRTGTQTQTFATKSCIANPDIREE